MSTEKSIAEFRREKEKSGIVIIFFVTKIEIKINNNFQKLEEKIQAFLYKTKTKKKKALKKQNKRIRFIHLMTAAAVAWTFLDYL